MTVPALAWEQTGTIPQRTTRMAQGGLLGRPTAAFTTSESPTTGGGAHGVVGYGDLLCSGTTLTIAVAAGGAFISAAAAAGGDWYLYNDASVNVALSAYEANPRIDLIVAWVRDNAEDASTFTDSRITFVKGTASGSPVAPAVPAGALVLARVNVPATSGPTTVTDRRRWAAAVGGRIKCRSTERPTGAALELAKEIFEVDTGAMLWYDGAAWRYEYKPPTSFTPTIAAPVTVGNAVISTDYSITNGICTYQGTFQLGSTTSWVATYTFTVSLPVAPQTSILRRIGQAWFYDSSGPQIYSATCDIDTGGSVLQIFNVQGSSNSVQISPLIPFTWFPPDQIVWSISYPVA